MGTRRNPDGLMPLRQRLREGDPLLGTFCIIPSLEIVELVAIAGFDAVILDQEHGALGSGALGPMVLAAHAHGAYAIVRVRTSEPSLIGHALDAGADGVLVPRVSSLQTAREVGAATRFAPDGARGANPWVRAARFSAPPSWFAEANEEVAVLVMVEGHTGIEALPDILTLQNLDGIFVGPVDLSHALGLPGQTEHPQVISAVDDVLRRAGRADRATGVFASSPARAREWMARGVSLVALGVDTSLALAGFRGAVEAARSDWVHAAGGDRRRLQPLKAGDHGDR